MPRAVRHVLSTGIRAVDDLLEGGLPRGAITEFVGPECSGRTSLALSFVAQITRGGCAAAWIDAGDGLDPESAAAAGVDLSRLLWVRCGVLKEAPRLSADFRLPEKYLVPPPVMKGLHGCGCGAHPRSETKGLSGAVSDLLRPEARVPHHSEPRRGSKPERERILPASSPPIPRRTQPIRQGKPWARIEQALHAVDLLLRAGGFAAIVLDMAGVAPEYTTRVPLATWFRYRAVAAQTQASLLLLSQHPCAKSSCELLLRFLPGHASVDETTVFTGIEHRVEVERRRFAHTDAHIVPIRKPQQRENGAQWRSRST
jgi:recombination protein RecA